MGEDTIGAVLRERRVSRRDFLKFCAAMAGTLALPAAFGPRIARALEAAKKPTVVWLEYQNCARLRRDAAAGGAAHGGRPHPQRDLS